MTDKKYDLDGSLLGPLSDEGRAKAIAMAFERSLTVDPNCLEKLNPLIEAADWYTNGCLAERLGDTQRAIECYETPGRLVADALNAGKSKSQSDTNGLIQVSRVYERAGLFGAAAKFAAKRADTTKAVVYRKLSTLLECPAEEEIQIAEEI